MLDQVLERFSIQPDYDLDIMKKWQTLADITTRALNGLDSVMKEAKPDIVLVQVIQPQRLSPVWQLFIIKLSLGM